MHPSGPGAGIPHVPIEFCLNKFPLILGERGDLIEQVLMPFGVVDAPSMEYGTTLAPAHKFTGLTLCPVNGRKSAGRGAFRVCDNAHKLVGLDAYA